MPRRTGWIEAVDMLWIIIVGVGVAAAAGYGFWPRKRGLADEDLRKERLRTQGRGDYYGGA
jgi:hypothetical protein